MSNIVSLNWDILRGRARRRTGSVHMADQGQRGPFTIYAGEPKTAVRGGNAIREDCHAIQAGART